MEPNIKSINELYKLAINSEEIYKHIKLLISEAEESIIAALQLHKNYVILNISYNEYNLESYSKDMSVKILAYHMGLILRKKNYNINIIKCNNGYNIKINLNAITIGENLIDEYLNKNM